MKVDWHEKAMSEHKHDLVLNINCYGISPVWFNLEIYHDAAVITEAMLLKNSSEFTLRVSMPLV